MTRLAPATARSRIVDILSNSVQQALGLREALDDERDALEAQDLAALDTAVEQKSGFVDRLKSLEEERSELCVAAGFDPGPEQMQRMSAWCDEDSVINNCWDHLIAIASDCNARNLTNGAIIRLRRQHIDSNLAVLRGADQQQDTYRNSGESRSAMMHRSLVRA